MFECFKSKLDNNLEKITFYDSKVAVKCVKMPPKHEKYLIFMRREIKRILMNENLDRFLSSFCVILSQKILMKGSFLL